MTIFHQYPTRLKIIRLSLLLSVIMIAIACKQKAGQTANGQSSTYYTCSMHPQVHLDHPGSCPICGMKLIKVEVTNDHDMGMNKITLNATQMQLAGIQTDTIRHENIGNEKTLTATVSTNENTAQELSARIAGRIQQLFVRTSGEKIAVGQPLYTIYSEDLLETEKEYLLARQQQKILQNPDVDYKQLIAAAENKLQLWGLSSAQIKSLASSEKSSATTTILSKINGTVSEIAIHEGDYVTEGMPILKTQNLSNLWVEAQVYASELDHYKEGARVNVTFPDLGGLTINGKVEFINPELSDASKVALLRVSIPNAQGSIRPGMQAYVTIASGAGSSLAVPASAIITNGQGSKVWIKNPDGSFSPKSIRVGIGNQIDVSVLSGLTAGDIVVTQGAYLLNSEAIFKNGNDTIGMSMKM